MIIVQCALVPIVIALVHYGLRLCRAIRLDGTGFAEVGDKLQRRMDRGDHNRQRQQRQHSHGSQLANIATRRCLTGVKRVGMAVRSRLMAPISRMFRGFCHRCFLPMLRGGVSLQCQDGAATTAASQWRDTMIGAIGLGKVNSSFEADPSFSQHVLPIDGAPRV
jgi:hypothetical protein